MVLNKIYIKLNFGTKIKKMVPEENFFLFKEKNMVPDEIFLVLNKNFMVLKKLKTNFFFTVQFFRKYINIFKIYKYYYKKE